MKTNKYETPEVIVIALNADIITLSGGIFGDTPLTGGDESDW